MSHRWISGSRWLAVLVIAGFTATSIGCGIIYEGAGGDLSTDGRPLTSNVIERDDMRLAVVVLPIYTSQRDWVFFVKGKPKPLTADVQRIAYIVEAKDTPVELTFAQLRLGADCQGQIRPRGVANVKDHSEIMEWVANLPAHWREEPGFDPFIELKERKEYPAKSLSRIPDTPIDADTGMSCASGEMMAFELFYPLPDCYDLMKPMTLVLDGITVGDTVVDPIEISVTKREAKWTKED